MTHSENEPSAEYLNLDSRLIAAIGRADDLIAQYIREAIGEKAYTAIQDQNAMEDDLDADMGPETE